MRLIRETRTAARKLSEELRTSESGNLRRRRAVVGLSMLGTASLGLVALYQMGIIKHLPEPRVKLLNAEKVDASPEAYEWLSTPDALPGIASFGTTILFAIGQEDDVAQCRLAEDYAISVETLSRRLGGLRRRGLIQLRDGPCNHQHVYSLTETGRKELRAAIPYWNRAQERLRISLGQADWELFFKLCDRVVSGAREALLLRIPNPASPSARAGIGDYGSAKQQLSA
jgi:DNA-binding MarR family transcriptional regulator